MFQNKCVCNYSRILAYCYAAQFAADGRAVRGYSLVPIAQAIGVAVAGLGIALLLGQGAANVTLSDYVVSLVVVPVTLSYSILFVLLWQSDRIDWRVPVFAFGGIAAIQAAIPNAIDLLLPVSSIVSVGLVALIAKRDGEA